MISPLALATDGFFGGGDELSADTIALIRDSVWTAVLSQYQTAGTAGKTLSNSAVEILEQLKADYVKSDTRFTRYRQGTQTIILDKNVSFDPDIGYTVTQR